MNQKGDFEMETLVKYLLAILLIVVITVVILMLKSKGINFIDQIKNILRFGG